MYHLNFLHLMNVRHLLAPSRDVHPSVRGFDDPGVMRAPVILCLFLDFVQVTRG